MQREREKYAQKIHAGKSLQCYRQVIRFTVFSNAPVTFKKYTYFKYNPNANIWLLFFSQQKHRFKAQENKQWIEKPLI